MIRPTSKPNREMRPKMLVAPSMLGQAELSEAQRDGDIRIALADWITSENNRYFARNFVNRYWAHLMGRGLVEPVDDLRETNPPTHPALMQALADDFIEHGYDLKHLLRTICNSRVYQLSSVLNPPHDPQNAFYTYRSLRRLSAEVLLDAINQAAGTSEPFAAVPAGTRAIALPDPSIRSYFLDTFGRPARNDPCECARSGSPDLTQALHLINGEELHGKVTAEDGRVATLRASKKSPAEIVTELYLATYSRPPREEELQLALQLVGEAPSEQEGLEDLLWALLNASQFVLNH